MKSELLIGATVGSEATENVTLRSDTLTTHGVILGMTGSGKTGLAVVILEELARAHVPLVICDLKGDMTNLLLNFPLLRGEDFAGYLPISQAAGDRGVAADKIAGKWRDGLARWGLGEGEIRAVHEGVAWQLLTPGSGVAPVDLLPALGPPPGYDPDTDPDGARVRLDGTAAGLLALIGRSGDPLTDRDHVLLATLLDHAWRQGKSLDLGTLIGEIADPPVSRFGVLDAESFYPSRERQDLVMAFNTVLASPAFSAWTRGTPLEMASLIGSPGAPRATILYLAHLAERERFSFLTLLFSSVLSWARSQPGADDLRMLLYLDEVQGLLPPTAMPPTKPPLLTLLKQGRAFGAGVLLATQNPVDLDYKALANVGLKMVGRLDTENDRRRALEGLDVADAAIKETVAGLAPRQFVMAGVRVGAARTITSRWAMSYLRGPLTLAEVKNLVGPAPAAPPRPAADEDFSGSRPVVPGFSQLFGNGETLIPHVVVEARVTYRAGRLSVRREEEGAWAAPLSEERVLWEDLRPAAVDHLGEEPLPQARLGPLPADIVELLEQAGRSFGKELSSSPLELLHQPKLKLVQDEGESEDAFRARCEAAARDSLEGRKEAVRRRFEARLRRVDDRADREKVELERDEADLAARQRQAQMTIVEGVVGALFGRGGLLGAARRGASKVRQVGEKQRMTERARAEVEESHQALSSLAEERAALEENLAAELAAFDAEADRLAADVSPLRLTPSSRDIAVRRVALAWLGEE